MGSSAERILIVDDDELVTDVFAAILDDAGWSDTIRVTDSRRVLPVLEEHSVAAVLLDLAMPHVSGTELLDTIAERWPEIPVIILTLESRVDVVVECMKRGAFDFMTKPVDENRLIASVSHAVRVRGLDQEVRALSVRDDEIVIRSPETFAAIVTRSDAMRRVFAYVEAVAPGPRAVLITGESGTGKELIARAVHTASGRAGAFVAVNVAGLDDAMFSDSLFGHRRGAYTGADSVRKGLVESAADGTLFLDEIGDLDNAAQVKLLRLLQEDEYYPLGSDVPERSRARVVAATNSALVDKVEAGTFRRDLYYRLMAHHAALPPLRDRLEDLAPLVQLFVADACAAFAREPVRIAPRALDALLSYGFPGNVRELQSIVIDAVSRLAADTLTYDDLARHSSLEPVARREETPPIIINGSLPRLSDVEDYLYAEALRQSDGNQTAAARLLGVSQSTLSRWLARAAKSHRTDA